MNTKNFKFDKYQDRIKDELNLFLRQEAGSPLLQFASITKVELSADYSEAKVYWDTFDSTKRGDIKKLIQSLRAQMKKTLSKKLSVRKIPNIVLLYDGQYDSEMEITRLLEEEKAKGRGPQKDDES